LGERGVRNAEVEGSNPLPSTTPIINYDGFGSGATPWRAVKNAGDEAIGLPIGRGVTELIAWGPRAPAMQ
jgi:hypothetical protein